MKIELTVEEYFNELRLMNAQYGQEEELYPWVYMLLKMAENRKQEILKNQYQGVSIRDVHNLQCCDEAEKEGNVEKIKRKLREQQGAPDIAILDLEMENSNILGCVEIKTTKELLEFKEGSYEIDKEKIRFIFNMGAGTKRALKAVNYILPLYKTKKLEITDKDGKIQEVQDKGERILDADYIKKVIEYELKGNYKISKKISPKSTGNDVQYKLEIKHENNKLDIKKFKTQNTKIVIGYYGKYNKKHEKNEIHSIKIDISVEKIIKNDWPNDKKNQILSHLEKFKKVLYTNGLKFYYLVLNEKENCIDVKTIADLTSTYNRYKEYYECYTNTMPVPPDILLPASEEWDRLIAGLTSINWYQG